MTLDEAARLLKTMVEQGRATNEIVVRIHLFGIKYANEIAGISLQELTERAGISETYKTEIRKGEIRKGMNLARYVQARP
jgi:hypothetical protein